MKKFDYEYMQEIANRLEDYHSVFSQLWSLGIPVMTTGIETACVWFDDIGDAMHMEINPEFWDSLTETQQDFVICHECFHVLLSHGSRMIGTIPDLANIAADVVINELLVKKFNFNRKEIDPKNKYCWEDKVLGKSKANPLETFEWYYNFLNQKNPGKNSQGYGSLVDDHSKLTSGDPSRVVKRVIDNMSDEEFEALKDKIKDELKAQQQAGLEEGGIVAVMKEGPVRPKPKWESIVKSRLMKYLSDSPVESWAHINRRTVAMHNKGILPVEVEDDGVSPSRRQIYLFLDTSGSCASLAPRFWELARSIPRTKFEVHPFCFDTRVYDINFKDRKLYGFGGTSFSIIEKKIQQEVSQGKITRYPDAIFVVTDGDGTQVRPEISENWHVLLTPGGDQGCFPASVHFYDLKEFD
jgi:hypothetical protein